MYIIYRSINLGRLLLVFYFYIHIFILSRWRIVGFGKRTRFGLKAVVQLFNILYYRVPKKVRTARDNYRTSTASAWRPKHDSHIQYAYYTFIINNYYYIFAYYYCYITYIVPSLY